ncbi:MAG: prepilin-type N-terminal cleavage/methylation domain-containing protein [Myxococcota bacterium]
MRRRFRRQAGFTLVEMMAALTAGLVAISAIYTISSASSKHFHEQQRISQTQMALRMGMSRLTRDISRAGFGGSPNTQAELNTGVACGRPPNGGHFSAVQFLDGQDTARLPNAAFNGVQADRIRLVGNYATAELFRAMPGGGGVSPTQLVIQADWQSFRRSFGVIGTTYDPEAFEEVFRPGRVLHIQTIGGQHFYPEITSSVGTNQTVTFTPSFVCGGERMNMALVAPLSRVEYRVVDNTDPDVQLGNLFNVADGPRGFANAVLVRQELDSANRPIRGSEQVVLEYVANVDFQFIVDTTIGVGTAPNFVLEQGALAPNVTNFPHRIRSVIVNLSARTADHDPTFPIPPGFAAPAPGQPITRYQVVPGLLGAARVRSMRSEVQLRNMRVIRP